MWGDILNRKWNENLLGHLIKLSCQGKTIAGNIDGEIGVLVGVMLNYRYTDMHRQIGIWWCYAEFQICRYTRMYMQISIWWCCAELQICRHAQTDSYWVVLCWIPDMQTCTDRQIGIGWFYTEFLIGPELIACMWFFKFQSIDWHVLTAKHE